MNIRISALVSITALTFAGVLASAQSLAQNAYVTNARSDSVSVISTLDNTVTDTIPVGRSAWGVAVKPGRQQSLRVDLFQW